MGHLLGYARVSTTDQHPQRQVDALERAGCYRVFTETASGARTDRPVLEQLLDQLRPGDTLVVWKLDRLGRSLRHLVDIITGLADRGVGFCSLQEAIDTTTPGGKLVFHVFAALAEFERDLIRERTAAGLAAARARGRHGGRPSVLTDHKLQVAQEMYASGQYTVSAEEWSRVVDGRPWHDHAATSCTSSGRSTITPLSKRAPARTSATRWGPLTARQRSWAASSSLNAIASPAALLPGPLVTRVRSRTEEKVDSIGLLVLRCSQCSAGKSKKVSSSSASSVILATALGHLTP